MLTSGKHPARAKYVDRQFGLQVIIHIRSHLTPSVANLGLFIENGSGMKRTNGTEGGIECKFQVYFQVID